MKLAEMDKLLDDWIQLNARLVNMRIGDVKELLALESNERRRGYVLLRLYGRFSRLRVQEETKALLAGKLPWRS